MRGNPSDAPQEIPVQCVRTDGTLQLLNRVISRHRIAGFCQKDLYRIPATLCDELAIATEIRISEILQATEEALEENFERGWDRRYPTHEPSASDGRGSRGQ